MSVFTNPASGAAGHGRAYTRAVLDLLGDRDPMSVLETSPSAARAAIAGMTDEDLGTPEAPGKWSVRQVVRHLADSEIVWGWRLRVILAADRPPLQGYDQDAWAERLGYASADVGESLDELEALRRGHVRLLRAATPADLQRTGVHPERGEESVAHLMRLYAGHDLLHLRQIERVRAAVEGRPGERGGAALRRD